MPSDNVQSNLRGEPLPEKKRSLGLDPMALSGRREVKVKLPASHVLRLYYLKITSNLNYSDVVEDALGRYFSELDDEKSGFVRRL